MSLKGRGMSLTITSLFVFMWAHLHMRASKRLLSDIKCSDAETSSLEGFHSTLNQWHPKMKCFSWLGTYCRL
jgi:hypothetical protein